MVFARSPRRRAPLALVLLALALVPVLASSSGRSLLAAGETAREYALDGAIIDHRDSLDADAFGARGDDVASRLARAREATGGARAGDEGLGSVIVDGTRDAALDGGAAGGDEGLGSVIVDGTRDAALDGGAAGGERARGGGAAGRESLAALEELRRERAQDAAILDAEPRGRGAAARGAVDAEDAYSLTDGAHHRESTQALLERIRAEREANRNRGNANANANGGHGATDPRSSPRPPALGRSGRRRSGIRTQVVSQNVLEGLSDEALKRVSQASERAQDAAIVEHRLAGTDPDPAEARRAAHEAHLERVAQATGATTGRSDEADARRRALIDGNAGAAGGGANSAGASGAAKRAAAGGIVDLHAARVATAARPFARLSPDLPPSGEASLRLVVLSTLAMAGASALGALPLCLARPLSPRASGAATAAAAGVMISVSFDLIHEGEPYSAKGVVVGCLLGAAFVAFVSRALEDARSVRFGDLRGSAARRAVLFVGIMAAHALGEGAGVGVSFAGDRGARRGGLTALAIAAHNVPEGLATASVLLREGVRPRAAAAWALVTALPQPLLAAPAYLAVDAFRAALPLALGFAAGSMVWMALSELVPDALKDAGAELVAGCATASAFALEALRMLAASAADAKDAADAALLNTGAIRAALGRERNDPLAALDDPAAAQARAAGEIRNLADDEALGIEDPASLRGLPPLVSLSTLAGVLLPAVLLALLASLVARRTAGSPAAAAGAAAALAAAAALRGAVAVAASGGRVPVAHAAACAAAGFALLSMLRSRVLAALRTVAGAPPHRDGPLPTRSPPGAGATKADRALAGAVAAALGQPWLLSRQPGHDSEGRPVGVEPPKGLPARVVAPSAAAAAAALVAAALAAVPLAWAAARAVIELGDDEAVGSLALPLALRAALAAACAAAACAAAGAPARAPRAGVGIVALWALLAAAAAHRFRTRMREPRIALALWRFPLGYEDSLAALAAGALGAAAVGLFAVGSATAPGRARGGAVLGTAAALAVWCSAGIVCGAFGACMPAD